MPAVQITASPAPPLADARAQAEPRAVPVMAQGPYSVKEDGVTPPSLTYKIEPRYTGEAKNAGVQGAVVLDIVVGPDGVASDITVKKSLDAGLDGNAIEAVRQWRFKPGMKDGHPVAVRAAVEVNFRLSDKPKVEAGGLARPQLLSKVEPQYTEEARSAKIEGTVVLNVEVTPEGRAQNIRVVKGIDPGLDNKAMEAIQQWVFKPAMKDGQPVSFQATIEVNFRLQ
jgi:TonB family protein